MRGIKFSLLTLTALAGFSVYLIISGTNPYDLDTKTMSIFYFCVFAFILGIYSFGRIMYNPKSIIKQSTKSATLYHLRQGTIIAIGIISLLILRSFRTLGLLNAVLIIVVMILFELFFRVKMPIQSREQT